MMQESYRQQLHRVAQAMALAHSTEVGAYLDSGSTTEGVQLFVDGNLEKRCEKLETQLEFVASVVENFASLVDEYVTSVPQAAYDTSCSDGDRMLSWLIEHEPLSAEQLDYVACQRARHQIEMLARQHRMKHLRFQELATLAEELGSELESNSGLKVHLNPIRTWARFSTPELLDEEATPPCNVLFFAAGGDVGSAVLELEGQALINELADYQPCTLEDWADLSQLADREQLIELCRELAKMGLVAFG